MAYLVTVPSFIRRFYGDVLWQMPGDEKAVYLTFDDGPHPTETPFVLDELKKQNAKATFFCIGNNVRLHEDIYLRILGDGHSVGNHTYSHMNGWKNKSEQYYADIGAAATLVRSNLFRPPYGRIRRQQVKDLKSKGYQTVMWTVISADFDQRIQPEQCVKNVMKHIKPGAIVVFHDSSKASVNLRYALPKVLEQLSQQGYAFKQL